jgi:hypothetical protein
MIHSRIHHLVSINGIIQADAAYKEAETYIMFRNAPPAGSDVYIVASDGGSYSKSVYHEGDGTRCFFTLPEKHHFRVFLEDLETYKDHPAVKDQIERLQVILALVKDAPQPLD